MAGLLGLAVVASGLIFCLGYLYAAPLFYGGPRIPMALNTAIAFGVLGLGLISAAGPLALPIRPFAGHSVRARLLRAFLPFTVAIVLVSDWSTQAVAWFAAPSLMAARVGGISRDRDDHRCGALLVFRRLDRRSARSCGVRATKCQ